jgi:DNA-binding HxlR family transcriptional regulator
MIHEANSCSSFEDKPGCIQSALAILGDKWTPLLLSILSDQDATFSELELSLEGISPRTLSQRLEKLCMQQIVAKHTYCERPPRYRYHITPKGRELGTILHAMADWGAKHHAV